METEIRPGRAVFLPVLSSHVWCFAISVSAISISPMVVDIAWLARGLFVFGVVTAVGFAFVFFKDLWAQDRVLEAHLARHGAITQSIAAPVAAPAPVPAEAAKPPIPFAPVAFVEFIFSHMHEDGNFPTVSECAQGLGCSTSKAQGWFTNIKDAGFLDGRIPFQAGGKPLLSYERFLQAAKDYMTVWDGK